MSCLPCHDHAATGGAGDAARVRYFFGQRLTAVDLADEQAYHFGRHRAHQRLLHGWGVVCGLTAERGGTDPEQPTRMLRVRAGHAVDCHGRDIAVPSDHCVDVGAWYARRRAELPAAWRTAGARTLWLVVRYDECPAEPVAAPRDPCGCTSEGCEHSRVREGFAFDLRVDLDGVCTGADDRAAALDRLAGGLAPACPACGGCAGWLVLAQVPVTLTDPDGDGPAGIGVAGIGAPVLAIPERRTLLPTWVLHAAAAELLARQPDLALPGPRLGAMAPSGTLAAAKLLWPVALLSTPATPINGNVVPIDLVRVLALDAAGWQALPAKTGWDAANSRLITEINAPLVDGTAYRVVLAQDATRPVVDDLLRPLLPATLSLRVRAGETAGALTLAPL